MTTTERKELIIMPNNKSPKIKPNIPVLKAIDNEDAFRAIVRPHVKKAIAFFKDIHENADEIGTRPVSYWSSNVSNLCDIITHFDSCTFDKDRRIAILLDVILEECGIDSVVRSIAIKVIIALVNKDGQV
jgi:hypothetical protein